MRKLFIVIITIPFLFGCVKKTENKTTLRVMSFNIRYDEPKDGENNWKFRRQACVDMINDQQPDVFGIQEGIVHQVNFLDSALVDFAFVGEGRDSLIKNNEYTAIFYHTGKFDLLRSGTNWLSETPEVSSRGWDAKYNRIVTWAHRLAVWLVADFEALSYQVTTTLDTSCAARIPTAPAINYTACWQLVFIHIRLFIIYLALFSSH